MSTIASIAKWKDAAAAVGEPRTLPVPLRILIGESVEVAKQTRAYWEPAEKRPGLSTAGAKLPVTIADDILSLHDAVQDAETAYQLVVEPSVDTEGLKSRGTEVLGEITAVLEWYLDDGVATDEDVQLESLKAAHEKDTGSADNLAQALHDYATLARPLAQDLNGLGAFDASVIDEAFTLSNQLGEVSLTPLARTEKAKNAKLLRDQLAHLLSDRMRLVRAAARFVFRNHSDIARSFTSAYERRRRAEARRSQQMTAGSSGAQ